jgi:hypothetical protein
MMKRTLHSVLQLPLACHVRRWIGIAFLMVS